MVDYAYEDICEGLKVKIREQTLNVIRGSCFSTVDKDTDTLKIRLVNNRRSFDYDYIVPGISKKIMYSQNPVDDILKEMIPSYKAAVLKAFFKDKV